MREHRTAKCDRLVEAGPAAPLPAAGLQPSRRAFLTGVGVGALSLGLPPWTAFGAESADAGTNVLPTAATLPRLGRGPPHAPSAHHVFHDLSEYYGDSEQVLLDSAYDKFRELGYRDISFFSVIGGGFAIAPPFERINPNGYVLNQDRFRLDPKSEDTPLGPKFRARRLRAFVVFLTSSGLLAGPQPKSFFKHRNSMQSEIKALSNEVQFAQITRHHRLTIFVYEYFAQRAEEPRFVVQSAVSALDHMQRSRLIGSPFPVKYR